MILLRCDNMFFVLHETTNSEVTERNSLKTGHMLASECDSKMYVWKKIYSIPSPYEWAAQKPLSFDDFATKRLLTDYICGMKQDTCI